MLASSPLSSPLGLSSSEKDAKALQVIEETTRNADAVQEKVLAEILSQNAEVEYLKRYKLGGATDRETFKSKVPVITYENIEPDIQRIVNGDLSAILSAHPISEFLASSGTSGGERKLFPRTQVDEDRRQLLRSLRMSIMNLYTPGLDKGKGLYFLFVRSETRTPGSLLARPGLTSYYKKDVFKTEVTGYTSPIEAIHCVDSFQNMYTQILCGLLQRLQVVRLGATFASGLVRAIRFLQLHWEQLADDIETGTLNEKITDPSIRDCMAKILKSDSELAEFVRLECSKTNWQGIITNIWSNAQYVDAIATGAMAQYIPAIDYYSGGLPLVSMTYVSTECYFGLNLNPMCHPSKISYTIIPNMAYFEFLPHEPLSSGLSHDSEPPKLVDLVDVEVGKEYEVVVTTYAGLYRYRVGDILRVTGFHNSAPQFNFVRRKNVLLGIDTDKTNETDLQNAVENASKLLREFNTSVSEYTSFADTKTSPGHYVIYWELLARDSTNYPTKEVLNECCFVMEKSLNYVYRELRFAHKFIGPLEIRIVKSGTFEELMDYAISKGTPMDRYKVPRCVSSTPIVKLLDLRVISTHFSPADASSK